MEGDCVTKQSYDENNIFAKILRGELPCTRVYEDDSSLAFMDIMPQTNGHVLVIPKSPARNLLDIDESALGKLMVTVKKIALAVKAGVNADGITIHQSNERAGGQVVFHLHFHIIPRRLEDGWHLAPGIMQSPETLEPTAIQIRKALQNPHTR
jgi:histidine triad (HIT) family protein